MWARSVRLLHFRVGRLSLSLFLTPKVAIPVRRPGLVACLPKRKDATPTISILSAQFDCRTYRMDVDYVFIRETPISCRSLLDYDFCNQ